MDEHERRWTAVDAYVSRTLRTSDDALDAALASQNAAGLRAINVTPNQGMFLTLLVRAMRATRVLELGTLGGYSTICLARGVGATGRVVSLELDAASARVARENLARRGLGEVAEVRVGPALASLASLAAEAAEPFDLVFLDADKSEYPAYLAGVLPLVRSGSVIVADNVVRDGAIVDAHDRSAAVVGVRRFYDAIAADPRLRATTIQTVGEKGYDGFAFVLVA